MKKISVFDTTISDYNRGNEIIMDSVYFHLRDIFPDDFFFKLPPFEITKHTLKYLSWSDLTFFGGTNALNARMEWYRQWNLSLRNSLRIKDVVLMGIGWWKYENKKTSLYTKILLKRVLHKGYSHAVRDSYTKRRLEDIGFTNVLNTGCPTLWNLTKEHCQQIPSKKSDSVVFTVTDYKMGIDRDKHLIKTLSQNYKNVYAWIQGKGDFDYINSIKEGHGITIIPPDLNAYDNLLATEDIDYVGTRLHGGIRALQKKRRTVIIGIDNRALEMKKDVNLPVIKKKDVINLEEKIHSEFSTNIQLPEEDISKWKNQFKQ